MVERGADRGVCAGSGRGRGGRRRLRTALVGPAARAPEELARGRAPCPPKSANSSFAEPLPTVQGKLCMLFTPGEPFAPAGPFRAAGGGGAAGRHAPPRACSQNVREKQSLCYYCAASYTSHHRRVCASTAAWSTRTPRAARAAILHELEALCARAEIGERGAGRRPSATLRNAARTPWAIRSRAAWRPGISHDAHARRRTRRPEQVAGRGGRP